jgi:serine protease AprX
MVQLPTAAPVCLSFPRLLFVFVGFLLVLLPADAAAQGRHVRMSDDLVERLRAGDVAGHEIIVSGSATHISALAERHGLIVRKRLKSGAVLEVPPGALEALTRDTEVDQISGNHRLRSQMTITNAAIGADQVWEGIGDLPGVTGAGVGVAIIDSGITEVRALRGRVVASVDFTDAHGRGIDRYGHGTHVAGIVAAAGRGRYDDTRGVAPGAHLVNLKVLDEHGEGTAGDVIDAIDWAVEHRRRYRIRVINMSLGGTPMQSWRDDPLCQAVQRAYDAGIVVVASAGNLGKTADGTPVIGGVTVPGTCPHSITVGALNTKGTAFRSDDEVATYSSRGPTRYDRLIKPDLVAPGNRIRGLLAPGSTLAREYPELVIDSGRGAQLELSGTSMASAVVSGAAALLVDRAPRLTPLNIQVSMQHSAAHHPGDLWIVAGAGRLHVFAALALTQREPNRTVQGQDYMPARIGYLGASVNHFPQRDANADAIVWDNADAIVWGNADAIVWGNADAIVWGNADAIVWDNADAMVWGNADAIVWGNADAIVWGNADAIVWGNAAERSIWGD